jgi:molybdopterin-containing oxidoreductase family iron-sulfur binding subunit
MFAATQIQHTIMGREEFLLREVSLKEFKDHPKEYWNPPVELAVHGGGKKHVNDIDLWAAFPRPGHKWGMSIDLNLCFGCGACVVACTAENNVAVVGKLEVSRVRDMHWLRIDRYYTSDMNLEKGKEEDLGSKETYIEMENPSANPQVTFQPMMCQHCNHAPCETVCPVLATSHSTEGLNMMTYNRCIGTRYCANNCPFKVRRFNWFNYSGNDNFADVNPAQQELGRMVLNPDVVVRSRGVMEKCSMCQQRLQAGKLEAKKSGAPIKDGTLKTACQAACSTGAIMFGDLNDTGSVVARDRQDERAYFLLEDIGIKPSSSYMVKVRNQDEPIIRHGSDVKSEGHKKASEKHS